MSRYLLFCLFLVLPSALFAQNSILAGIITDTDDQPVAGATIRLSKAGRAIEISSGDDGLFYTQLIPSGTYHLDVITGGRMLSAKRVFIPPSDKKRTFFYLTVLENGIRVRAEGKDPFMRSRLSRIEAEPDNGGRRWIMRIPRR